MLPVLAIGGVLTAASCLTAWYSVQSCYYYRALPDHSFMGGEEPSTKLRELDVRVVPIGLQIARSVVVLLTTSLMKFLMLVLNRLELVDDERSRFLTKVIRSRPKGVPLITVSNHASSFDDPGLLSAMLPWDVIFTPSRVRWAIATQEICFPNKPFVQAFMTAGQVLPIYRGGGLDQPLFFDFARMTAAGCWLHVFPEARVVQTGALATDAITKRNEEELEEKGRLKWGSGKLIAHSPRTPIVVPFHHYGMVGVLPQHNVWKKRHEADLHNSTKGPSNPHSHNGSKGKDYFFHNNVISWKPQTGNKVKVWVGPALEFQDLIDAHERKHGALWKMPTTPASRPAELKEMMSRWKSSDAEKQLYSAITRRIEDALLLLQQRAEAELQSNPDPKVKHFCERALRAMSESPEEAAKLREGTAANTDSNSSEALRQRKGRRNQNDNADAEPELTHSGS